MYQRELYGGPGPSAHPSNWSGAYGGAPPQSYNPAQVGHITPQHYNHAQVACINVSDHY